ncbi:MAG: LCP family protein [Phascolarctobacterium sp.]|nr:LCP family protein [Phascolarctobacterium sp.]
MRNERGATNIIAILTAAFVFVAMLGYYFWGKAKEEESFGPSVDGMKKEERLSLKKNIVVLGVDERPEEDDPGRSDTLFVMMLDTDNKSIGLLSIPRDTRVRIPKYGYDKINHAYPLGGRELTQRTVEEFLGIRINNYVMVDFKGFKGLVDAIGGVDIDIENDMYYRDSWDGFTIDLKKGKQHLNGETAIQYVRFRDEEGDLGRVKRQQHFLMAMYEKIASEELLKHIPGLAKQLSQMVKTDMDVTDMITMGRALHSMVKTTGISMKTVPGTPEYINDISYVLPDIQATRKLMAEMQGAEMTGRYKSAAELMAAEYNKNVNDAMERKKANKDNKEDKIKKDDKAKDAKASAERKLQELKKKQSNNQIKQESKEKEQQTVTIAPVKKSVVVRVVNCSGAAAAGDIAAHRLRSAGFTVIRGGSGNPIAETTVISTTNNGAVVSKLSSIPFAHNLRITRDGAADCDGVVMLGKNFQ